MNFNIYSYGNGDILIDTFNAIALIAGSSMINSAIMVAVLSGFLMFLTGGVFAPGRCPGHRLFGRPRLLACFEAMKNRLKVLRAERDWSQADLAHRLDVSRQSVNAIETGKYDPSLPLAFKIARLFRLRIEQVFEDTAN